MFPCTRTNKGALLEFQILMLLLLCQNVTIMLNLCPKFLNPLSLQKKIQEKYFDIVKFRKVKTCSIMLLPDATFVSYIAPYFYIK